MNYVILAVIQMLFNTLKILEIKYSYDRDMKKTMLIGFALTIVWLFSTALGVSAVIEMDYYMMGVYIVFSMLGKYIALKLQDYLHIRPKK
jgi:predicted neutral ceramidase superfamily lipid hydrolase